MRCFSYLCRELSFLGNMNCLKLFSIIAHPVFYFRDRTMVMLSRFRNVKKNSIKTTSAIVKKTNISFQGEDNEVVFDGSHCHNCNIVLHGKGNRLIVDKDVQLFNLYIKISGESSVVTVGEASSFGGGFLICGGKGCSVSIGSGCMIAEGVDIWSTDSHNILKDGAVINPPRPIRIGNHVWIGKDVAVLKGVSIGDNAVIGMRSVVTHDVAPGTLCAGSPLRELNMGVTWEK